TSLSTPKQDVGGRDKPGHDDERESSAADLQPHFFARTALRLRGNDGTEWRREPGPGAGLRGDDGRSGRARQTLKLRNEANFAVPAWRGERSPPCRPRRLRRAPGQGAIGRAKSVGQSPRIAASGLAGPRGRPR